MVDICGEKLNEEYVRATVADLLAKHQLNAAFWMMAPGWPAGARTFYTLFVHFDAATMVDQGQLQSLAHRVDEAMQESYHYEYARRLGQLAGCRLFLVAPENDAFHTYLAVCATLGQRLGDIKPTALHAYQRWAERFSGKFIGSICKKES